MNDSKKEIPVYVCSHIFENSRPVLLVCKEDGDWQFLCGEDHPEDEVPRVVGLNHLIERDETLKDILSLEDGHEAERVSVGLPWNITKIQ